MDKSLVIKNINDQLLNWRQVELRLNDLSLKEKEKFKCNTVRIFIKDHSSNLFWIGSNLAFDSRLVTKNRIYDIIASKSHLNDNFQDYDWSTIYENAGLYEEERDVLIKCAYFGIK
jgi:hypothetical protein